MNLPSLAHYAQASAWGRALAWLCAVALVFSQTLVALHGVGHRAMLDGHGAAPAQEQKVSAAQHSHWLNAVLPSHTKADDCQAFDQLNHADKTPVSQAAVLPLALFSFQLALSAGLATARWHAQFEARGPPASR